MLSKPISFAVLTVSLLILAVLSQPVTAAAQESGFVYAATNNQAGNAVVQYIRSIDGRLAKVNEVSTGGKGGTGNGVGKLDPLGSQDSLVLDDVGSLLLVVNAGSNQLSALQAGSAGLKLLSTVPSGGNFPNSVALNGNLIYVLNAHSANITGFRITSEGILQKIPNSTRSLPGGSASAAHDIRFTPDGTRLVVSEGGTNQIDVFELNNSGTVGGVTQQASAGSGPFGMKFGRGATLLNSEANTGSVSSYDLTSEDMLTVISGAVADTQKASCWITLTADARVAFVSNTGSGTISSYNIAKDGTLHLEKIKAGVIAMGAPIDSALTTGSEFLYAVDSALGRIVAFRVNGATLTQIEIVTGLPQTVQGIAAK